MKQESSTRAQDGKNNSDGSLFSSQKKDFTHLASPKSATFTTFSTPTKQFLAAKSRWM
jgi:hypothetical protein